ncbi:MAG: glycosyltransferase family 39 protein [Planctomycetia bacterium]|nr:MAG: glycosyltransferase family 39 protein [Planctomycetia bacterium]
MQPPASESARSRPARHGPSLRTLVLIALGLGILARLVRYGLNFPLWGDEAFVAVDFLARGFVEMLEPLTYRQIVPLGYMWATLCITLVAGLDEYALRLLPTGAGIAALWLFWRFCRRQLDVRSALLALAFLAPAYYPIRHAVECKPYSTDLLVALLLLMTATIVLKRPLSPVGWILLAIGAALAPWCSYPSAFLLAGIVTTLAICRTRSWNNANWLAIAGIGAIALASFTWNYFCYAKPQAAAAIGITATQMWDESFPPIRKPWLLPLWLITTHVGNLVAYPVGAKNGGSVLTAVLIVIGAMRLWRVNRPLMVLLLSPLPFNLVAAALEKYPYGSTVRTSMYLAPSFCLLAGVGLLAVLRRWLQPQARRRGVQVAVLSLCAIAPALIVMDAITPYKKRANYEARRVVRALADEIRAEDRVLVLNALSPDGELPFIQPWRGDGAQFIYYLSLYVEPKLRSAGAAIPPGARALDPERGRILWGPSQRDVIRTVQTPSTPNIDALPARHRVTTWALFFGGAEFAKHYDSAAIDAFVAGISNELGPAAHTTHVLQRKRDRSGTELNWQAIEVYRFGAAAAVESGAARGS